MNKLLLAIFALTMMPQTSKANVSLEHEFTDSLVESVERSHQVLCEMNKTTSNVGCLVHQGCQVTKVYDCTNQRGYTEGTIKIVFSAHRNGKSLELDGVKKVRVNF